MSKTSTSCSPAVVMSTRTIIVRGVVYPTIVAAAKATGNARSTIWRWLNDDKITDVFIVDGHLPYVRNIPNNEGRIRSLETRLNYRIAARIREENRRRKVSVHGYVYNNVSQAAEAVGLSPRTIARYATNPKKLNFFFVEVTDDGQVLK